MRFDIIYEYYTCTSLYSPHGGKQCIVHWRRPCVDRYLTSSNVILFVLLRRPNVIRSCLTTTMERSNKYTTSLVSTCMHIVLLGPVLSCVPRRVNMKLETSHQKQLFIEWYILGRPNYVGTFV